LDSISLKKKPSGWLRKVLLLASYQLIVQERTSAGAVVSETVSEVKSKEGELPGKFANALLRKVAEHAPRWRTMPFPKGQPLKAQAQWASLPEWFWKKIVEQHGLEWACAYAQASLERPVLWIRGRSEDWKPKWSAESGPVPCSWKSLEGGGIVQREGFQTGEFIVQDISSQFLISEVSAKIKMALPKQEWSALDLCAAPGGKSVGLAWNGFSVVATDRMAHRLPLLEQTVARAAPSIRVVPWESWSQESSQNLIWVDAPCSGTGILRRHPDVRWLRKEKELSDLIQTQRKLLSETWSKVRAGDFMVYSVCSVLKEEGPEAIQNLDLESAVVSRWFLSPQDEPFGDGFWAVLLRKPSSN
jgi:16S rRNA (cytosine967-C5)-methyltransferase